MNELKPGTGSPGRIIPISASGPCWRSGGTTGATRKRGCAGNEPFPQGPHGRRDQPGATGPVTWGSYGNRGSTSPAALVKVRVPERSPARAVLAICCWISQPGPADQLLRSREPVDVCEPSRPCLQRPAPVVPRHQYQARSRRPRADRYATAAPLTATAIAGGCLKRLCETVERGAPARQEHKVCSSGR